MASGGTLPLRTGKFTGTGAAKTIDTPGFKPKVVKFVNQDGATAIHTDTMAAASVATQDSGTDAFPTTEGVTLRDEGFAVGTNPVINGDGDTIHWIALA